MDEKYLLAAARYVELNPVRAGIVPKPEAYPWSSAAAHLSGFDDTLVRVMPLIEIVADWREFLSEAALEQEKRIREHERTGRPLGSDGFVVKLEQALGLTLRRQKPGPKRRRIMELWGHHT
jgi:putative transposase